MPYKGQVQHSTGNRAKTHFYKVLLSSKMEKIDFFQNPSFKFQNTISMIYLYHISANATLKSLQTFRSCILSKFSASVRMSHYFLQDYYVVNIRQWWCTM